ncbi:Protein CBG15627 [Caenorhabditis briggsae]|uniref:Protein CBG15627 n=1 Tax=Caenorhabditis briggsae TaxID=6238 RepID=B0K095_CAEBR|nr:Protein CBG15627 [Caenorhabditis briggsae]CAP33824.1 Protein CBG15627 [Caenorhabditis briggsae]
MTSSFSHQNPSSESLEHALTEAASENALLRLQVSDLNSAVEKMKQDYELEILKYTKEAKTAGLKAKVAATARIKELESSLEEINAKFEDQTERLQEEVDTLRSSRNWEIEQNGHLKDQVAHLKEKTFKLTEELDASEKAKRSLDSEVDESNKLMELMVDDLLQDIDRLKEAIVAQDRFIEILEADIVIYEQHIGLLRENLGASQIDHRALIKSKAFETKLLALEREKEQSAKKSNEDRLKTKALDKKCRVLVEQNEQLMARLCELEMSHRTTDGGGGGEMETATRRIQEQEENIRQISSALESERDVSQRLREAKEALEKELIGKRKQEESQQNRIQMDVEMSRMQAQSKIDEMSVEVDAARRKVTEVQAEVEQLRATNFDLQMTIETAKRTMEELADSNEQFEKQIEQIEEEQEEKDEDLKQAIWDVDTLTRQNEALRVELDGARQAFHETRALSEEVKSMKADLQKQQEFQRAQFEGSCSRIPEAEDVPERKTSLEVQQEEYIQAYEEKIEDINLEIAQLKKELELSNGRAPQRKTTAVLEPPSVEKIVEQIQMTSTSSAPSESQMTSSEASPELLRAHEQLKKEIEHLKTKNADFTEKMEVSKLSGELNVELGRAMLELEEHNELLRKEQAAQSADDVATGRELELHVMMVQEMTEQIASMQAKINEMEAVKETQRNEMDQLRGEATTAQSEVHRVNSELQRMLHNLAESEIARKDEFETSNAAHDEEIREFSIKMEDSRRQISDLEVKLKEAEEELSIAMDKIAQLEVERQQMASGAPEAQGAQGTLQIAQPLTSEAPEAPEATVSLLHNVTSDMNKLIELKDELEIAVQALKAEIWSLNGQLKASILDREGLEDKITELDDQVEREKKRAIALDVELQEQVDLTDRAVRRAAEAENESNHRMAECLENETMREEIEQAYTRLNEYYNQLQEAYNTVYAQLAQSQAETTPSDHPTTSSAHLTSSDAPEEVELTQVIDGILTILLISRDPSISLNTRQKMEKIAEKLKQLLSDYEENQKALEEQRRITVALEARLQTLETASGSPEVATTTRQRVEELEGEIEWKEEECEALKRRIRDLEKALEAVAERAADETEAAAVSRLSTELAILAARLTTRQADVDSLFRTNAELAHTNVRLQNEVDEMEEVKSRMMEEKEQLEQHVKELEEQVADLMEQHETHLQQSALLQSTTPILTTSSVSPNPDSERAAQKLEESEKEIQRLAGIEKTLNNRILALEDQNLELEEKVQEIEDEMMTVKAEMAEIEKAEQSEKKAEQWDDWGEEKEENEPTPELQEAQSEVGRLLEVEKALTMRLEMLQMHNKQLEGRLKELEVSKATVTQIDPPKQTEEAPQTQKQDDEWGWGEDDNEQPSQPSSTPLQNPSELENAKSEVTRLAQIEKILNNRILALEDQNLELEERLQELEDELAEEKKKKGAELEEAKPEKPKEEEDNWDDWGEESEGQKKKAEDGVTSSELLQKTIEELQKRVDFQKEVIQKAEAELIEIQDKYDELDEAYQQSQNAQNPNEQLLAELESLKMQLEQSHAEKQEMKLKLETIEAEKRELETQIAEIQKALDQKTSEIQKTSENDDDGWGDEGWGESDNEETKKDNDKEVKTSQKIDFLESEKTKIEQELDQTIQELDDVKQELIQKEKEIQKTSEEATWNDDAWNDDGEIERMRETQKMMEMRVEALQDELKNVKEREIEARIG